MNQQLSNVGENSTGGVALPPLHFELVCVEDDVAAAHNRTAVYGPVRTECGRGRRVTAAPMAINARYRSALGQRRPTLFPSGRHIHPQVVDASEEVFASSSSRDRARLRD